MESQNQKVRIIVCTGGAWENVHGVLRYRPLGLAKRVLLLPLNLTCSQFKTCVARKLYPSMEINGFRLTYEFPLSSHKNAVVDIADEEDVTVFMDMAVKSQRGLVTLYIVESASSRRCYTDTGNNGVTQNLFRDYETANAIGTSENRSKVEPVDDCEDDESDFFGDDKASSYGSKAVSHLKFPVTYEKVAGKVDNFSHWLKRPPVSPPAPDITPAGPVAEKGDCVNAGVDILWLTSPPGIHRRTTAPPDITPGEPSRPEKRAGDGAGKDMFWGMPPSLMEPGSCSDPDAPKLFRNKEALKIALRIKCLEEGFNLKTTKTSKDRYTVKCASDACTWRISGTKMQDSDMFEVRNFKLQHTCCLRSKEPLNHPEPNRKLKSQFGSSFHRVDSDERDEGDYDGR